MNNKLISILSVAVVAGLVTAQALAGHPNAPGVSITLSGGNFTAKASIGAAHNSSVNEAASCTMRAYNSFNEGGCSFTSGQTSVSCTVTGDQPAIYKALSAVGGSSYIEVSGVNGGFCTDIMVDNNSKYVAKKAGNKSGFSDGGVTTSGSGSSISVEGSLGAVRNTADANEYIECSTEISGTTRFGKCSAKTSSNTFYTCGTCATRVEVQNGSNWAPKH